MSENAEYFREFTILRPTKAKVVELFRLYPTHQFEFPIVTKGE